MARRVEDRKGRGRCGGWGGWEEVGLVMAGDEKDEHQGLVDVEEEGWI